MVLDGQKATNERTNVIIYSHTEAIVNMKKGIAARTASLIAKECANYPGRIYFEKKTGEGKEEAYERADCKSVMGLMILCAGPGSKIDIFVEGSDENAKRMALRLASGLETVTEGYEPNFERYSELK